MEEVLDV